MTEEEIKKKYKNNIDFIDFIENISVNVFTKIIHTNENIFIEDYGELQFQNINFNNINITNDEISYNPNKKIIKKVQAFNRDIIYIKNICQYQTNNSEKHIIFSNCQFNDLVFNKMIGYSYTFIDCNINSITIFDIHRNYNTDNVNYQSHEKYDITFINNNINMIEIHNSIFDGKFYINDFGENLDLIELDRIDINMCTFNENFKLNKSIVKNIYLNDINFEKDANFLETKIGTKNSNNFHVEINNVNIKGLAIFEKCEFYNTLELTYLTFKGLAQFRKAKFFKGVNLEETNTENEMNFYGVEGLDKKESIKETSQETYRIIKYNCERIGNRIDANKFHALELQKKKENLKFEDNPLEFIVFYINWISSNFGTNWAYALGWIFIIGLISAAIINYKDVINFYNIKPIYTKPLFQLDLLYEYTCKIITQMFTDMSIVHYKELEAHPILFFFNKVALGYLYYQFVTAVRKDTRK